METTRDQELADFKTRIDLEQYAAAQGYVSDRRARSSTSRTMKHADGDKIIIGMGADGHWIYCSIGDFNDNGSIIDFVMHRRGYNLGQVRRELRPWLNNPPRTVAENTAPPLKPVVIDLAGVRREYEAAEAVSGHHPYLTDQRSIPATLLASERFACMIRSDQVGAALFPHWNLQRKICGFEKKNQGFTGFAKGGQKGAWGSRKQDTDAKLVICETAIDALSYAALFGYENTRFASTGGALNPLQPGILNQMIRQLPEGCEVIAAVDHDEGGLAIAETLRPIFESITGNQGRDDLSFRIHHPEQAGQDWNDVLKGKTAPLPSPGPS